MTILRPLRGLDCNLYENLEASFLQDYPNFDILFSVADESDAAISIVEELMKKYPNVKARLIIGKHIQAQSSRSQWAEFASCKRGRNRRSESQNQ